MNRPIGLNEKPQTKRHKAPISLRIIQGTIRSLELVAPNLAFLMAWRLFCTPIRHRRPEREHLAFNSAHTHHLPVDRFRIQVYQWGPAEAPAILFVHGWSGRGTQVSEMLPELLDAGYQVIAFDAPAHGLSDGKTTNLLDMVNAIRALVERFSITAAIGHSFGGVAMHYLARQYDSWRKIVTISTPMEGEFILTDFMQKIGGSARTAKRIRRYIEDRFDVQFNSIFPIAPTTQSIHPGWLIVHDHDDREVPIGQAHLARNHPDLSGIIETKGLGHSRILRDAPTIRQTIAWLKSD